MKTLTEWMVEAGIAENGFSAGYIKVGLKLDGIDRAEQEARCRLYRAWRPKTDQKDMIPTYQAYDLAIAGIDPADVEVRQMDFQAAADEYIDAETEHYESYFKDVMEGRAG
jgi:hypothetical protein